MAIDLWRFEEIAWERRRAEPRGTQAIRSGRSLADWLRFSHRERSDGMREHSQTAAPLRAAWAIQPRVRITQAPVRSRRMELPPTVKTNAPPGQPAALEPALA